MTDSAPTAPGWKYQREPDRVTVDGIDVALRRSGAGATVLYLHGVGFTRQWLPFHQELAGSVDLIAPELPGFGDTTLPEAFEDFEDYVLHYDSLIEVLGLGEVHLAGHGLGARLAAHLASVYPRRFKTLTLIAPSGLRVTDETLIDVFRLSPEMVHSVQFNSREDAHRDTFELRGFPDDILDAYADSRAHALLAWTNRFDRKLARRAGRITTPTLVIAPEDDRYGGRGAARRYADLIPDAQLVTPAGPSGQPSSYALHIEQPAEVASLVAKHVGTATTPKD